MRRAEFTRRDSNKRESNAATLIKSRRTRCGLISEKNNERASRERKRRESCRGYVDSFHSANDPRDRDGAKGKLYRKIEREREREQ